MTKCTAFGTLTVAVNQKRDVLMSRKELKCFVIELLSVTFYFRKNCSKAEKTELIEKTLNLIAGHSHEVSTL